jgi:hypothetical protein
MSLLPVPPLAVAAVAAVASRGWTPRRRATIATASSLACLSVAWRSADPIEGSVLAFVALMAAACCLVFVLAPRPELAPRAVWLAWTTAALAWSLAGGRP